MTVAEFYTCDICRRPSLSQKDMACRVNIMEEKQTYMIDICKICFPYYTDGFKKLQESRTVTT